MSFDGTLPATGVTTWENLYATLRSNFVALNDLFTPFLGWSALTITGSNWSSLIGTEFSYYKDNFGFVHMRGALVCSGSTALTVIATLPAGYRPIAESIFRNAYDNSTGKIQGLTISTSGTIVSPSAYDYSDMVFFDGIFFKAA